MKKIDLLFTGLTLSVLFSLQLPLPFVDSNYASINMSDFIILAIGVVFLIRSTNTNDWTLDIPLPNLTGWFLFVGSWIMITLVVAAFRSSVSILPNILWALKWFEIVALLILAQQFADQVSWQRIVSVIIWGSLPIAMIAILRTVTTTGWTQPTVFWNNPSTLAIFLGLPGLLSVFSGYFRIRENHKQGAVLLVVALVFFTSIGAIGSRAGVLTVLVGIMIAGVLARKRLSISLLATSGIIGATIGFGLLWATGRSTLLSRYFPTVAIENGGVVISGTGSAGINTRIELLSKGIDLWTQRPIFGYGWFASPENPKVGFLDNFYVQVLVDTGVFGFIMVMVLYLAIIRVFLRHRHSAAPAIVFGGVGWVVGLLVAGLGGAHPRTPRLMFLLILLLISVTELTQNERILPKFNN